MCFCCFCSPRLISLSGYKTVKDCLMHFLVCQQCDQIGPFSKILGDKSSFNSGPYICQIFGLFLKLHFLSKNCSDCFLGNLAVNFITF